jgi:hypothetical protein
MAWPCSQSCATGSIAVGIDAVGALLRFTPDLLTAPLPSKRLLGSTLVTWFEIEGMLFNIFDDVFLLHLALEAAECTFDRLAVLDLDFSHALKHPLTRNR